MKATLGALALSGALLTTIYPSLSTFKLPASFGAPAPYGEGGGGAGVTSSAGYLICLRPATRCQSYTYGLTPRVPTALHDGPYGSYTVSLFGSSALAGRYDTQERAGAALDQGGGHVPYLSIAHPVSHSEWLRGKVIASTAGDCYMIGGVQRGRAQITAMIVSHGGLQAPGALACTNEFRWARDVLAALYSRVPPAYQ